MDADLSTFKTLKENFSAQSEKSLRWRGSCSRFDRASSMPLDRPSSNVNPHRKDRHNRSTKNVPRMSAGSVDATDHKIADFQKLNRLLMTGRTLSDSLEKLVEETTNHSAPSSDDPPYHPSKQSTKTREDGKWFRRGKPSDRAGSRLISLREISSSAPLIEIVESGPKGFLDTIRGSGRQAANNDARTPRIFAPLTPDIRVHIASDSDDDQDDVLRREMEPGRRLPASLDGLIDSLHCIADERARMMDGNRSRMDDTDQPPVTNTQPPTTTVAVVPTNYLRDQIASLFQVSDNKLALKLFGNKNALLREKLRQKAVGNCVIHPCSTFRLYWDLCMLMLLVANLIILPVGISFFYDDNSPPWIIFNSVSDTIFLLDLLINFRTGKRVMMLRWLMVGIMKDNYADEIILDPKEIAKHYVRSWFVLDLISSLPLDYLTRVLSPAMEGSVTQLLHAGRALKMFRLVKLLSLLRLLRLSRLVRYVSQWEEFISSAAGKFMRIFNLISMILLLGHWNGCLQFLVPMLQDFPADSWVTLEDLQDADWSEQYTWALFKALSHMLSIGFGRYAPQSTTDVWLTMISMLTGATCYALFVGHTTTLIQSFDTSRRLYNDKLKQVEEYMISRKLPRQLRQRISNYYEHRYHGKMFDEDSILGELNDCLREEIVNFNCRSLVSSVPFFTRAMDSSFVSDVVSNLKYEVYQPGDIIIREGSVGDKMFFIQEGIVDIVDRDGKVKTSLGDGAYFGEICLLMRTKRVASVRALSFCNLFSLSVEHLQSVLDRYPAIRRTMETVAMERLRELTSQSRIEEI